MTAHKRRWRPLVVVGLVSGLIQVAAGVAMYVAGVYFASWSALVSLVVLAACIAAGTRWYGKHVLGGRTTYWSALLVGVVIAVVTGLTYVTYNIISISFVYPHFLNDMVQAQFEMRRASGMDPSQASQVLESLRAETTIRSIVVANFVGLSTFGTVLSALTAAAFRKKKEGVAQGVS